MGVLFRHLKSLVLPLIVLVAVPWLLLENREPDLHLLMIPGAVVLLIGLFIMGSTMRLFAHRGEGTLAPWDPPKKLLTNGLYAYVRNPMILGVLSVLFGEAMIFLSWRIAAWAALFFLINTLYFKFSEEPGLEKRFGEEYIEYKKNIPRWLPKFTNKEMK
ncbi:MAG: isoprenylcysteine carboxylmethyltransferase family protein [Balneolaceae bacterium]|nr:MAG: isoprenylcysteine carboxylmethyltransferase family protein [Balneolaceae bacterium]